MKIKATPIISGDLKPGDLFSTASQEYWDHAVNYIFVSIGEKVYIRTNTPTPSDQKKVKVFKIEIIKEENEKSEKEV